MIPPSPRPAQRRGRVVAVAPAPLTRAERVARDRAAGVTLEALRDVLAGVPAVCVIAHCTLCHDVFNPLGGPCGSAICPRCLREWLPALTVVCCSRCGPSQRGQCPIARAAEQGRNEALEGGRP